MNQSPRGTRSPQEVQTHKDEDEPECSGVIAIATRPATTLFYRLGAETTLYFFPSYSSEM